MTTTTDTPETTNAEAAVEQVDPTTLLVDVNVRKEVETDKDFVASIKEFGVLQPVIAVRTADGQLRVKFGHRRTMAAIAAQHATVPVLVAGDETTGKAGDVERILSQYAENEHRAGLTGDDKVGVIEQLRLLDVSPAQIAKKTRLPKADVEKAITVAGSQLARAAHDRYELTLEQAAAVAEFEDAPETFKQLVVAAKQGWFDRALDRAQTERRRANAAVGFRTEYEAQDLTVIDEPDWNEAPREVTRLTAQDGTEITVEAHAECPGHVVWGTERWVRVNEDGTVTDEDDASEDELEDTDDEKWEWRLLPVYGCLDPATHGHLVDGHTPRAKGTKVSQTEAEREAAEQAEKEAKRKERREVIAGNKAWDAATEVRQAWVKDRIASRKSAPKGAAGFVGMLLARETYLTTSAAANAAGLGWLPVEPSTYPMPERAAFLKDATDGRALVVALTLALAAHESNLQRSAWRAGKHPQGWVKRYLTFLQEQGYDLSDIERKAAGLPKAKTAKASKGE